MLFGAGGLYVNKEIVIIMCLEKANFEKTMSVLKWAKCKDLPVTMLGIAFLCSNLQGLFFNDVRSSIKATRLETIARKQNAITVFISNAALYVTQLSISGINQIQLCSRF